MGKYHEGGGSAIFSYPADLLTVRLQRYGSALEVIWITAYLRHAPHNPPIGYESRFVQYHNDLNRLPKLTFQRKRKRVDIEFVSRQFTAEDERGWKPTADKCNRAMGEVLEALQLLKKRIKPSDDFDIDRFLEDAAQILTARIDSDEEWLRIREQAGAIELALNAAKDAWELLETTGTSITPVPGRSWTILSSGTRPMTVHRTGMIREPTCWRTISHGRSGTGANRRFCFWSASSRDGPSSRLTGR
jgi:hypothetical protein